MIFFSHTLLFSNEKNLKFFSFEFEYFFLFLYTEFFISRRLIQSKNSLYHPVLLTLMPQVNSLKTILRQILIIQVQCIYWYVYYLLPVLIFCEMFFSLCLPNPSWSKYCSRHIQFSNCGQGLQVQYIYATLVTTTVKGIH